jgi:hypothetical protein
MMTRKRRRGAGLRLLPLLSVALLLPAVSASTILEGGSYRLQLLLPGGAASSADGSRQLHSSIGQSTTARSHSGALTLRTGFHTPAVALGDEPIFGHGFEQDTTP